MHNKALTDKAKVIANLPAMMAGTTVFISSACVMTLELVSGRLAAKVFVASLYTWTSVIGVTLAGLTIGSYVGGKIADRFRPQRAIGWLLMGCSLSCIAAIALNNVISEWSFLWRFNLIVRILAHISISFFIPTLLIGAIVPVAVKTALESDQTSGTTVGVMYALGAAGSILGTFLAGFWLIASIGTINTIWVIAIVMLAGAIIYLPKSIIIYIYAITAVFLTVVGTISADWAGRIGAAILLIQGRSEAILYETESEYSYIAVRQVTKEPDERQFVIDNMKDHSRMIMGRTRDLQLSYTKIYAAVTRKAAGDKERLSFLTIGGGGIVFPRYIEDVWPGSRVDVVEIDPAVTEAAIRAFGLPVDTPINIISLDGRNYVDDLVERKRLGEEIPKYDFVYLDAFNSLSVPFQLTTQQFNEKIPAIMSSEGIYMVNMIDMLDSGKLIGSFVSTLRQTFPYVSVVTKRSSPSLPVNFIVISSLKPVNLDIELLKDFSFQILQNDDLEAIMAKADGFILDDDYAPVENFIAPTVQSAFSAETADKYIERAERLIAEGKWEKAVSEYRSAVQVCPSCSAKANFMIGMILSDNGKLKEATSAFDSALKNLNEIGPEGKNDIMPAIHYNMAVVLRGLGDTSGATKHFAIAIGLLKTEAISNGGQAETLMSLGQVYAASGNMREATLCFEKVLEKAPDEIGSHLTLLEALAVQKRYDEAKRQLNKSIEYMQNNGREHDVEQLKRFNRRLGAEMATPK